MRCLMSCGAGWYQGRVVFSSGTVTGSFWELSASQEMPRIRMKLQHWQAFRQPGSLVTQDRTDVAIGTWHPCAMMEREACSRVAEANAGLWRGVVMLFMVVEDFRGR